jgi:Bacterial pre-peptidase C-terminal domain
MGRDAALKSWPEAIRAILLATANYQSADGTSWNAGDDSDLDVWLYDPDGILVASSASYDSNNEVIEFTPTKAGPYTIKVRGFNVPSDLSSYYGIAWTTHYELCN